LNENTFNSLLKICMKSHEMKQALALLKRFNLPLSIKSFNILIDHELNSDNLSQALK